MSDIKELVAFEKNLLAASNEDVGKYGIKPCQKCGEKKFLQVLPKFKKFYVHCVNCGNRSYAMSTKELAVKAWNKK